MKININRSNFLNNFWQKKPFFLKKFIKNFNDDFTAAASKKLLNSHTVDKKIFIKNSNKYTQESLSNKNLNAKINTVLFYKTNYHHRKSYEVLNLITFIPKYLIDDVMISQSTVNGSVGAHIDNYSVFLIQGYGEKKWIINFNNQEYIFNAKEGDLIYIPPGVQHFGIASTNNCNTYSIGFRAPDSNLIQEEFNSYVFDRLDDDNPKFFKNSIISKNLISCETDLLDFFTSSLDYNKLITDEFIGYFLTKVDLIYFKNKKISFQNFRYKCLTNKLILNPASRVLFLGKNFYINGSKLLIKKNIEKSLKILFLKNQVEITDLDDISFFYDLFKKNYILFELKFSI